jgi:hypothetical protein
VNYISIKNKSLELDILFQIFKLEWLAFKVNEKWKVSPRSKWRLLKGEENQNYEIGGQPFITVYISSRGSP